LEHIVRAWYEISEPNIGTKQFGVTLAAFIRAWTNVKVPKNRTVVYAAFDRAKQSDLSWVPTMIDSDDMRLLVGLCRELQEVNGKQAFYLDCRTVGDLFGMSKKTAWKWLDTLCVLGVLKKVSTGSLKTRKANEYRFPRYP